MNFVDGLTSAQNNPAQAPTNQAPAPNPLDQLRDIYLPEAVDQFPYAPGWWILLALVLTIIGFYLFRFYQYKKAISLIKPAKVEIDQLRSLNQEQIDSHSVALLTTLIKRICLIFYPTKQVASLSGDNWWKFLNHEYSNQSGKSSLLFSDDEIEFLLQAPYQKEIKLEQKHWYQLLDSSEQLIETLIKYSAKKNRGRKSS